MAFIQRYLTGTALSWYIRLNDTYKQNWPVFVQAFEKKFSYQKHAKVEAVNLVKKVNETDPVQQLVEKSWCNQNESTIIFKCIDFFFIRTSQKS